jgi:radical SAM protein with 4Fe4S-binding SPASM domain
MKNSKSVCSGNSRYLLDFNNKSARLRVPLSGTLDLTHRCNLGCVHCYNSDRPGGMPGVEMDTRKIFSLLDEICDAGCLYLLITGGEPLLRQDFPEIYTYAREKGLLITVFTNGTLISDRILTLFRDLPPRAVEISVYGAAKPTYEKITGVEGSYEKCISGISRLLERNIQVRLKTILMTTNKHEFYDIEEMARKIGVKFRFDAAIFPRLNGDQTPVRFRVSAQDAVEREFSDAERVLGWEDFIGRLPDPAPSGDLYECGAGITGFYIDPYGNLRPCLMTTTVSYDLTKGNFPEGWEKMNSIRARKTIPLSACTSCEMKLLCGYCPAFFELETGDAHMHSEYLCSIGRQRVKHINNISMERSQI